MCVCVCSIGIRFSIYVCSLLSLSLFSKVPAIREALLKSCKDQWEAIADRHTSLMLEPHPERVQELAKG